MHSKVPKDNFEFIKTQTGVHKDKFGVHKDKLEFMRTQT